MDKRADKYGTGEIQSELLRMLKDFHAFCVSHDISYSLADGTLLGAVRERGFIPWDDDVDIMLSREDYEKFRSFTGELKGYTVTKRLWIERMQFADGHTEATVDMLIMDDVPDSRFLRRLKLLALMTLQGMLKEDVSYEGLGVLYKLCAAVTHGLGRLVPKKWKLALYTSASCIGRRRPKGIASRCGSGMVSCTNDEFALLNHYYEGDLMRNPVLHPFEDTECYIIRDSDAYLTGMFGDYMTPPPEEERRPSH